MSGDAVRDQLAHDLHDARARIAELEAELAECQSCLAEPEDPQPVYFTPAEPRPVHVPDDPNGVWVQ